MRKLFIAFFALVMCTATVWAQSPQKMSYQAVVRNATNQLIANTTVGMKISMLQGSASGTAAYVETQTPVTNANGLVSIEIGGGTLISGTFSAIDWANGPYFIKTETDPAGGTNYTITGVSQLLSVPYALYALSAGSLSSSAILLPAVATVQAASNILSYSATVNGTVNGKGLSSTVSFEYGLTTAYGSTAWAAQTPVTGASNVAVSAALTGLQSNTTYHYRIKTSNAVNISYSDDVSFTTVLSAPQLTTTAISSITGTTASSGGNIYDGGASVTARGVCWSTTSSPTTADSKTTDATGTGAFVSAITGLANGTKYYVRAYATNSVGTSYGSEVNFTTYFIPTLTTAPALDIKGNTATAGGAITNVGGGSVTAQGLCWSTSATPTTANSVTTSFTAIMTGLSPNTTYYVRSYATNPAGTGYGSQISFNSGQLIGATFGGGLVFYNDGLGHGLSSAPTDQSAGIQWYNGSYTVTGATATAIGTGNANTNTIVASQGAGSYAAKLCADLVLNTYSDWYLPSKDELNLMYVNLKSNSMGGFAASSYWSSSENYNYYAWNQFFSNGNQYSYSYKYYTYYVRAVRAF